MKSILLFLIAALLVAFGSATSDYLQCVSDAVNCVNDNCDDITDACSLASCVEMCYGESCKEYCDYIECPPGNSDESCLVTCGDSDYHRCSDASGFSLF